MLFVTSYDFDLIENSLLPLWLEKTSQKSKDLNIKASGLTLNYPLNLINLQ